ncbi:hypothetical protein KAJ27_04465 [bacterium]|nr:hypothetical protein [bacterium]
MKNKIINNIHLSILLILLICSLSTNLISADQHYLDTPLSSPIIFRIFNESNRLWLATLDGFNVFSKGTNRFLSMKTLPLNTRVITSIEKYKNTIWFGTFGNGIYKIQGGEFIHYDMKNSGILSDYINDLKVIRNRNGDEVLLIATSQGISVLDELDNWGGFSIHDGLLSDNIKGLEVSLQNGKFLAYGDFGLQLVDYKSGDIKTIMTDTRITSIKHWSGKFWVGTVSKGVIRLKNDFKKIDFLDGSNSGLKSNSIIRMIAYEKELFFLTPDGIFSFNSIYWKTELEGRKISDATDFSVSKNSIFVSTSGNGFYVFDKKKPGKTDILGTLVKKSKEPFFQRWKTLDRIFGGAKINDLALKYSSISKSVNIYAATTRGFFEILDNGKQINRYHKDNSIFETNNVKKIAFKNYPYSGQFIMFISTYGKGLYRYDGKNWSHIGKNQGLLSNYVNSADYLPAKNEFWFGTTDGINRYNQESWKGFYNLNINLFQKVKKTSWFNGKYYFATDFGIGVFDGRNWSKIGLKEGLNDMVVSDLLAGSDKKNLYIGTQHGGLFRWNGKNVLNIPIDIGAKSLLGFKEIKSICLHDDKLYVTFKNALIRIASRRQTNLKKIWYLPEGTLKKVLFYDRYIFVVYDYKVLFTKYHKWEKL